MNNFSILAFYIQKYNRNIALVLLSILMFVLSSCAKDTVSQDFNDIRIGISPIVQPMEDRELLAGYFPSPRGIANNEELMQMQVALNLKMYETSRQILQYDFVDLDEIIAAIPKNTSRGRLAFWIEYAKYYDLDFLITPYLIYYNDKESTNALHDRNSLMLDFYLLDMRDEGRIAQRVHFAKIEPKLDAKDMYDFNSFIEYDDEISINELLEEAYQELIEAFQL